MKDRSPLLRQWTLLRAISAADGQATVKLLVEQTGVSEKTIRRDLATYRSAGFPIDEQAGEFRRKSYRMDPRWSKPDIGFTFDEALALYLGREFLRPLGHHLPMYFGSNVRSVCQSWFEYDTRIARQFAEQSLMATLLGLLLVFSALHDVGRVLTAFHKLCADRPKNLHGRIIGNTSQVG